MFLQRYFRFCYLRGNFTSSCNRFDFCSSCFTPGLPSPILFSLLLLLHIHDPTMINLQLHSTIHWNLLNHWIILFFLLTPILTSLIILLHQNISLTKSRVLSLEFYKVGYLFLLLEHFQSLLPMKCCVLLPQHQTNWVHNCFFSFRICAWAPVHLYIAILFFFLPSSIISF